MIGKLLLAVKPRRLWLILGWALVLLVIYLSLTPTPIDLPIGLGDKFSHVLAYFVLMSWFANIYDEPAQRPGFAVGFLILGVALEFFQHWSGYRSYELADMVACAGGVAAGWVLSPPRVPNYLQAVEKVLETGMCREDRNKIKGRK